MASLYIFIYLDLSEELNLFFHFRGMDINDFYCFKAVPLSNMKSGTSQCEVNIYNIHAAQSEAILCHLYNSYSHLLKLMANSFAQNYLLTILHQTEFLNVVYVQLVVTRFI